MTKIGYARVSTIDQNTAIQVAALRAAGCYVVREEKASGTTTTGRTELATVLNFLRAGDVLVVTRIDRLARSIGDLQTIVRTIRDRGAALQATEQPVDTNTAAGKAFLDMLGVFAERASPRPKPKVSTRGVSRQSTRLLFAGCAWMKRWDRRPSLTDLGVYAQTIGIYKIVDY